MEARAALITGGGQGIGKAYAEILLQHGIKVCLIQRTAEILDKTASEFRKTYGEKQVLTITCDVTEEDQLEDAFQTVVDVFGRLDIVVNNAGYLHEAQWKKVIATNLTAVMHGCYLGVKYMGTDNGGRGGVIINTSSVMGLCPCDFLPSYCASKIAVVGFTRSLGAVSQKIHGVRINCICPVGVKIPSTTDTTQELSAESKLYCSNWEMAIKKFSEDLGDMIEVDQVAEGFWTLVSDDTISGQCMLIGSKGNVMATGMPSSYQDLLTLYTSHSLESNQG